MHIASRRKTPVAIAAAMLVIAALAMGSASAANPANKGAWTGPFEEGGASTPRCVMVAGRFVCKPAAVGQAALTNGSVLYMNGVESNENIWYNYPTEVSPESRDSLSRVLNLTSGSPTWSIPNPQDGGGSSPQIDPGSNGLDDPFGYAGVPGDPGAGLVGSLWGMAGLPPQNYSSPPDDIQENDGDLFCTDMVMLADGRILVAGGSDFYNEPAVTDRDSGGPYDVGFVEIEGLRNARVFGFNPSTGAYSYTQVGHMKWGRWYPSLVTLQDGKVLAVSGVTKLIKSTQLGQVRRTETFDPATNQWTENYVGMESENSLPLYPRVYLTPNGKVFYTGVGQTFGPNGMAGDEILWGLQQFFDPATKKWEIVGPAQFGTRGGATMVPLAMSPPYDKVSLLQFGGTLGPTPGSALALPLSAITTVDNKGTVTNELTGLLNNRRWFSSGVTLPDGSVVAFSGADKDEVLPWSGSELPVRQAELFDPATKTWKQLSSGSRDRTYHNSAMLLADGRVLVGGHAPIGSLYGANHDFIPGVTANNDRDSSFEVFSPPYLFRGVRPTIGSTWSAIPWGATFPIQTNAGSIHSVVLSRLPSPQHTTDTDTRTLKLNFAPVTGGVNAVAPPNGTVAPPGYYYLFVLKNSSQGPIPSVARIVKIGSSTDTTDAPQPFPDQAPAPSGGSTTPDEDSSYLTKPPPLPVGSMVIGLFAAGAGLPALRRRFTEEDDS